jgi:DNA-binding MarR family transcriptional regulator
MANRIDLGILLGLAYQSFVDELRRDLSDKGFKDLGPAYGYVFRALDAEALHLRPLSRRLGMTDQGAAKIVDEMEARGYLERYPDPTDGRVKKLRLAPRGRSALQAARRFHAAYERRLANAIGGEELAVVRRVLATIVASGGTDAAHARLRAI